MKAPLSWLKDYVDIDCSAEELERKLFSCGFEVEETFNTAGKLNKVVVCKIIKIEKHPNADKLSVTQVDAGEYGVLQIITAATNIFEGAIVPVALDGATLYNGERIFNGKLRGLPSQGMFCGGEELGINDDWYEGASVNGILILKEDYPLGAEIVNVLELNDIMFDINVTANRPDCQSILGLAREVSAVLNKPLKMPELNYVVDETVSTKSTVLVEDIAPDLCPRYISHLVKDIKIADSPRWLKRKLFRMGIRSINNIVDITNFVLLEIGQPMHAFDLNDLYDSKIIIRRANENEVITTLDEKEFKLNNNNLVICDAIKPVAIAGIMGGLNSGIKNNTENIVFESAKFARDNIRKTSRTIGQRSEASSRYEKGIDAYTAEIGMNRALNLINKLNCGKIACDRYDLCFENLENKVINTTIAKVNGVLGIDIPENTIKNILERLNFGVEIENGNLRVTIPLYREDMESYPDIAEELIREYGYDHITPTLLKTCNITNGGRTEEQNDIENIKNLLVGFGFNEIINYSFVSEKEYDIFSINKPENVIKILNPLGEDLSVMRTSLLPSTVRTVVNNLNRKNYEGRLFELAKVYNTTKFPLEKLPEETLMLSISMFGESEDYFTIKGVIEGILNNFCSGATVEFVPCVQKCMHPSRSAEVVVNGTSIGYFGQINPVIANKLDVDKPILAGELNYDALSKAFNKKIVFKSISKFPIVERDLAILVDENVSFDKIYNCIKNSAGEHINSVNLFDIYQGNQVEVGKKSMAFSLVYVSTERTLTVEEIDQSINNILSNLKETFNAELR